MVKVMSSRLQQCLCPFTMLFVEVYSELDFSDIYQITFFGDGNFENTSVMRVIFFLKCSKFNVDLKNEDKNPEKVFYFSDKCI